MKIAIALLLFFTAFQMMDGSSRIQRALHPGYIPDPRMSGNVCHSMVSGSVNPESSEQEGLDDLLGV